jgi:hypothetical protein
MLAQPGLGQGAQPGYRPSRHSGPAGEQGGLLGKKNDPGPAGVLLRCASLGGHIPTWDSVYRPSSYNPAWFSNMPAREWLIRLE